MASGSSFERATVFAAIIGWVVLKESVGPRRMLLMALIALGAVIVVFMARVMFHLSFGSPGLDAIIGASAALVLIPTEWAYRRRNRRR